MFCVSMYGWEGREFLPIHCRSPRDVTDPGWSHHPGSAQDTGDTRGQAEHGGGAGLTMRLDDLKGLS